MQLNQEQENTFFTLIVKEDLEGVLYDSYLIAYHMSDSFALAYEAGTKDLRQFEGTLQRYVLNSGRTFNDIEPFCEEQEIVNDDPDDTGDGPSGPGDGDLGNDHGDTVDGSSDGTSSDSGSTGDTTVGGSLPPIICSSTQMVKNCGCTGGGCAEGFHSTVTCGSNPENDGVGYGANASFLDSVQCFKSEKSMYGGVKASGCGEEDIIITDNEIGLNRDCNNLEDLANSASFHERMAELIANNSGNTEIGYWGYKNDQDQVNYPNNDIDRFESNPNVMHLDPSTPQDAIDSYIHNHFNGVWPNGTPRKTLPVPSGADLSTLYNLNRTGRIKKLNEFVMVMTAPGDTSSPDDDTVYAITISNTVQFNTLTPVLGESPEIIDLNFAEYEVNNEYSSALNEKNLANLLKDKNYGLTLYRGDKNNLSSWTRLKPKTDGSIRETNCN